MKILAIRLKNLASMEGETEIDFTQEPLCSAGIFAITGSTGAGKSTILDALCLALYAKTPRYTQGKEAGIEVKELNQGDVRGILRNGTGDGYAEVDFVGIDDKKYRATWAVKRARNKAEGAIQKDTLTIKDIGSGLMISAMKTEACREIERLVGLSFEQFTRSVLLAQGDFTAFLKADNNDKASLLEKLTGTAIYTRISQQVFNNYRAAQSVIEQLNAQLENVEVLSEEGIKAERQKQDDITNQLCQLQKQHDQLQQEIYWQEKLVELNKHRQLALRAVDTAKKRKEDTSDRFKKLKLIEESQKIRSTYELHDSLNQQYSTDKINLQSAEAELKELQCSQHQIEDSITLLTNKLNDAIDIRTKALPLLNEARSLDVQLTGQEKNVLSANKAWIDASERSKEKEALLVATNTSLKQLEINIQALEEWKKMNLDREPIAINILLIRTKLEEASRLLNAATEISRLLQSKQTEACNSNQVLIKLNTDLTSQRTVLDVLTREQADLQHQLNDFGISSLETTTKEHELLLQKFIPARASWKLLYEKRCSLRTIKNSITELLEEQTKQVSRLNTIVQQLPASIEKKNASDQRLTRAKLEISESVELLRNQLSDGQACPVCGSVDHPYTKHHPQVESILKLLEKEANDDFQVWTGLLNEKQVLNEAGKKLTIDLHRLESVSRETALLLEELERDWKLFQLDIHSLPESEVIQWLDSSIKQYQFAHQDAKKQIDAYSTINAELQEKQRQFIEVEKKYDFLVNQIGIESGKLESTKERIRDLDLDNQHRESELSHLITGLNVYFSQASWHIKWKESPADFIKKLEGFEVEWKDKHSELNRNVRNKELIEHSILQLKAQVKDQQVLTENHQQELDRSNSIFQELRCKRKTLFDGKAATDVESHLEEGIVQSTKELEKQKLLKQNVSEKIAASNSLIEQLLKLISNKEITIAELMQKINTWISKFNASNDQAVDVHQLKDLLSHSHDWIEEEQLFISAIDRLVIESEANLRARETEINDHANSVNAFRELEILYPEREKLQLEKSQQEESLMHIKFRLDADASNKKRAGKIIHEIEAASINGDNWSKLNEMIGSADGKKFRQVAQEYTLDVLLGYANEHLNVLSRRYQLKRIENTLGLLVLDKDMGDEERTVVSLSGGESFLVSLALALGLASLSSTRMKVESLFIDEGFGSLDPATLNIAMDALERLHNQGRKVGVISHVQEMQERIMTQIKVVKQSTGKSVVTVEG